MGPLFSLADALKDLALWSEKAEMLYALMSVRLLLQNVMHRECRGWLQEASSRAPNSAITNSLPLPPQAALDERRLGDAHAILTRLVEAFDTDPAWCALDPSSHRAAPYLFLHAACYIRRLLGPYYEHLAAVRSL